MKDIAGFEGRYAVTEDGRVWSYPKIGGTLKGKWLTQFDHRRGYKCVYLTTNNKSRMMFVHTAVALAYFDNPENKREVNHKDGNKHHNCIANLEWSDRKHNMKHAYAMGLLHDLGKGEKHYGAKLTLEKAREIRSRYIPFVVKQRDLAREYGVTQRVIWGIVNNELWKEPKTPSCTNE